MSYILDALKKAENERNLGAVPHLHAHPEIAPPDKYEQAPRSVRALVVALTASVLLLAALIWFRPWSKDAYYTMTITTSRPDASEQAILATPAIMRSAPPLVAPQAVAPAERPLVEAAPSAPAIAGQSSAARSGQVPAQPATQVRARASAQAPAPVSASASPPATKQPAAKAPLLAPTEPAKKFDEPINNLRDLPAAIQQQIPALVVNGYIYAEQPSDRSIIINRKFLREGEQVTPDLLLEKLTPTGMVLNFRGYRYRTPY